MVRRSDGSFAQRIDIGAYERQTVPGLSLVVDTLADENDGNYSLGDLSLREAIGLANGSIGADTITFARADQRRAGDDSAHARRIGDSRCDDD